MIRKRKRIRLRGYDYSKPGLYFVTICVQYMRPVFGDIKNGIMGLNMCGIIVHNCWTDIIRHYPNCRLDAFIIMPNHIHGILEICDYPVGDGFKPSTKFKLCQKNNITKDGLKPSPTHGLPEIIRGFKTFSARRINKKIGSGFFKWQRSYYDQIIRDSDHAHAIRRYIGINGFKHENML